MFIELTHNSKIGHGRLPLVLGIGGTTRPNSTSERALRRALSFAKAAGATTEIFAGRSLLLPLYDPTSSERSAQAELLISALRRADAIIFASPAYHGTISGVVKNAIDYIEDMREDRVPYLADRAVGTIVSAYGDQAIGGTLASMRSITHALRGWPLPLGVGINALRCIFDDDCRPSDEQVDRQLRVMIEQGLAFARMLSQQSR